MIRMNHFAQRFREQISEHILANGLKLILHEDHSIPSVAMHTFWRVGSCNEQPGLTGLSHFFEHMMFNGAQKYGPNEFDMIMEAHGGSNNAFTNQNITAYQNWLPASALEIVFDLEADRIAHLALEPDLIESERGVVISERRATVESDNFEMMDERLWATAYQVHPYRWPVIGWMADIESWKRDDLKNFFHTYYSPNRATMVLAGDFDTSATVRLAEKYFGRIATNGAVAQSEHEEPPQLEERRVLLNRPAQFPAFTCGYHIPATDHADYYALRIIETILTAGQSSRMYSRLVDQEQVAVWVRGGFGISFDPTLFVFTVQPKERKTAEQAENVLYEELERLGAESIGKRELQKAKNIRRAAFFRGMKTIAGKADMVGTFELYFGGFDNLFTAIEQLDRVTAEDIQRVAHSYFQPKNRTVVTLVPE